MRRGRLLTIGVALAAAVGVAGCGGSSKTTVSEEQRIAKAGLLRLEDFPAGWSRGARVRHDVTQCPESVAIRRAALAREVSDDFSQRPAAVGSQDAVLRSARAAAQGVGALGTRRFLDCLRGSFAADFTRANRQVVLTSLTAARVPIRHFGDQAIAVELVARLRNRQRSTTFYVDLNVVRQGRALAFLIFFDSPRRLDEGLRTRLTGDVVARLRAAGA